MVGQAWVNHKPFCHLHANHGLFSGDWGPPSEVGIQTVGSLWWLSSFYLGVHQPHSSLPLVRKHCFRTKSCRFSYIVKEGRPRELLFFELLAPPVYFISNSGAKLQTNVEKVYRASGFVSNGSQGWLTLKLALSHLFVCPGFTCFELGRYHHIQLDWESTNGFVN